MLCRLLTVIAVVGCTSVVHGAALVSLVQSAPGNGLSYAPGEQVRVDFYVQLDAASPATVHTRILQFDLADSSPELDFIPIQHHPLADAGPIPFWNLSGASACAGDESLCGTYYFIDGSLGPLPSAPEVVDVMAIAYVGMTMSDDFQLILRQSSPTLVGSLYVVMPATSGNFVLDVLNADSAQEDFGADLRYGFGSPWDESVRLRAETGGMIMAPARPGGREDGLVAFAVVPEPATLALLAFGGLATMVRRHRMTREGL